MMVTDNTEVKEKISVVIDRLYSNDPYILDRLEKLADLQVNKPKVYQNAIKILNAMK